jgi:hypothetical protein
MIFADGRAPLAILNSKGVSDYDPTGDAVDNMKNDVARAEEVLGVPQLLGAETPLCASDGLEGHDTAVYPSAPVRRWAREASNAPPLWCVRGAGAGNGVYSCAGRWSR